MAILRNPVSKIYKLKNGVVVHPNWSEDPDVLQNSILGVSVRHF